MLKMTRTNLVLTMTSAKGILIVVIFNQRNFVYILCVGVYSRGLWALMRRWPTWKRDKCINNDGSYTCECFPGYDMIGEQCFDINECDDTVWQGMDLI